MKMPNPVDNTNYLLVESWGRFKNGLDTSLSSSPTPTYSKNGGDWNPDTAVYTMKTASPSFVDTVAATSNSLIGFQCGQLVKGMMNSFVLNAASKSISYLFRTDRTISSGLTTGTSVEVRIRENAGATELRVRDYDGLNGSNDLLALAVVPVTALAVLHTVQVTIENNLFSIYVDGNKYSVDVGAIHTEFADDFALQVPSGADTDIYPLRLLG